MVTTTEAAQLLRIDERQVRGYIARRVVAAEMTHGGAWSVDPVTVRAVHRARGKGRRWDAATAWGALELIGGQRTARVGASQRSRLRGILRELDVPRLAYLAEGRGDVFRLAQLNGRRESLTAHLELTGASALAADPARAGRFGLTPEPSGLLHCYADPKTTAQLVERFALREDVSGDLLLRIADGPLVNDATIALDLYAYGDTRESAAGRRYLEEALRRV